jgi:dTMP kinase
LLDLDPARRGERLRLAGKTLDRLEREGEAFYARVREGFLDIASSRPGEGTVLDATRPAEELHAEILAKALEMLG